MSQRPPLRRRVLLRETANRELPDRVDHTWNPHLANPRFPFLPPGSEPPPGTIVARAACTHRIRSGQPRPTRHRFGSNRPVPQIRLRDGMGDVVQILPASATLPIPTRPCSSMLPFKTESSVPGSRGLEVRMTAAPRTAFGFVGSPVLGCLTR
jgi:hypothetical protein